MYNNYKNIFDLPILPVVTIPQIILELCNNKQLNIVWKSNKMIEYICI